MRRSSEVMFSKKKKEIYGLSSDLKRNFFRYKIKKKYMGQF